MELNGIMNEGQNSEAVLSPYSTSSTSFPLFLFFYVCLTIQDILSKALQKNKNSR